MSDLLDRVYQAVVDGDDELVSQLVREALGQGIESLSIFDSLDRGIKVVGDRFGKGDIWIFDLMAAAQAMKTGADILEPVILESKVKVRSLGRVVMGTVEGDIHEIGKNIVIVMLKASGFEVIDLGVDVSTEKFVEAVKELKPDIIGMSALLTSTLPNQARVIDALRAAGLRSSVKVMIGGAPVTEEWAKEIGADGYARDAFLAVKKAQELLGK